MEPKEMSHAELVEAFLNEICYMDDPAVADDDNCEAEYELSDEDMRNFLEGKWQSGRFRTGNNLV